MGRKLEGRIEPKGQRFVARLRKQYLGVRDTVEAAQALIDAAIEHEKKHYHARSVRVLGDKYLEERERLEKARREPAELGDSAKGSAYIETEQNQPLWDRYVVTSAIVDMPVDKVTRDHIRELIKRVIGQPAVRINRRTGKLEPTGHIIGERTAQKVLSLLRGFFRWCTGIKINPVHDIPLPKASAMKVRKDTDRIPHLHLDEIDRLFALPISQFTPFHRAVYALGIYAGLRRGEVAGLRWMDIVDLYGPEPEVYVRRSYKSVPKTESSQRELPMLPQLVRELKRYREWLIAYGTNPKLLEGEHLLFPSPDTGKVRGRGWDPQWRDIAPGKYGRRAQDGFRTLADIRVHIQHKHVRHSCATHLAKGSFFESGKEWPMEKVALFLGHTDIKMTKKHYASRDVDVLRKELRSSLDTEAAE